MTANRFKAVVFDLDDTLYPERQYLLSALRRADEYLDAMFGFRLFESSALPDPANDFTVTLQTALARKFKTVEPLFIQRIMATVEWHTPRLTLYPDAQVALAWLAARGLALGLLTDQPGHVQRRKVRALGLDKLIDSFVYCDDLGGPEFWKPAVDPFVILALQLELEPQEIIYVGDDSDLDFIAPRRLGMGAIRVARSRNRLAPGPDPAVADDAHVVISSLDMIGDAIGLLDRSLPAPAVAPLATESGA